MPTDLRFVDLRGITVLLSLKNQNRRGDRRLPQHAQLPLLAQRKVKRHFGPISV